MKNLFITISTILIAAFLVGGMYYKRVFYGYPMGSANILLHDVNLQKDSVTLNGSCNDPTRSYSQFKYKIDNHKLLVYVYYGFVTKKQHTSNFHIVIQDQFQDIQEVYLCGESKQDRKLVFTKSHNQAQ